MDDTEACWGRKQQMQSFCGEKDLDVLEEQRDGRRAVNGRRTLGYTSADDGEESGKSS